MENEEDVLNFDEKKTLSSFKGSRIYGNDKKALIKEAKFRKKLKRKGLGFTNKLAVSIMLLLFLGLFMGYKLAVKSIEAQYTGALMCYTCVFTPIGTACSIVLACVVQKNKAENTGADGMGITFAAAQSNNFKTESDELFDNSPAI